MSKLHGNKVVSDEVVSRVVEEAKPFWENLTVESNEECVTYTFSDHKNLPRMKPRVLKAKKAKGGWRLVG